MIVCNVEGSTDRPCNVLQTPSLGISNILNQMKPGQIKLNYYKGVVLLEGRLSLLQHLFSAAKSRVMSRRLMRAPRRGKGQTLLLELWLFHTVLHPNPQSVAQSDLSGIRVIHTARLSGIEMKSRAVKVTNSCDLFEQVFRQMSQMRLIFRGPGRRRCVQTAHLEWVKAPACSLEEFSSLPLTLQRVNHSRWPYCLREAFIASSCCWKLDFPPGAPLREIQVSYRSWQRQRLGTKSLSSGGKRGHFTILSTWGHVIDSPSSAEPGWFIIKPLQSWSTINTPDWPPVTKCTNTSVFCQLSHSSRAGRFGTKIKSRSFSQF